MSIRAPQLETRDFCSDTAKSLAVDPIGSAGGYDAFVVVDFPLPWARAVTDTPGFPAAVTEAVAEAKERGSLVNVLGIAPDPEDVEPGMTRVMLFTRPSGPMSGFARAEYVVPEDDAGALVRSLLSAEGDEGRFASFRRESSARDLFVCTHGARDACCGKFGALTYMQLDDLAKRHTETSGGAPVRVWRVSHLGGHRFAPTVLDMPTGQYWGSLDDDVLSALVTRATKGDELRPYYRGWGALSSPLAQVAEGELFRRFGWRWLDYEKTIETVSGDATGEAACFVVRWSEAKGQERGAARVDVGIGRRLRFAESCHGEPVPIVEYRVIDFTVL